MSTFVSLGGSNIRELEGVVVIQRDFEGSYILVYLPSSWFFESLIKSFCVCRKSGIVLGKKSNFCCTFMFAYLIIGFVEPVCDLYRSKSKMAGTLYGTFIVRE